MLTAPLAARNADRRRSNFPLKFGLHYEEQERARIAGAAFIRVPA